MKTPEEWAAWLTPHWIAPAEREVLYDQIATAIRSAVAEARAEAIEQCARIAEEPITNPRIDLGPSHVSACQQIARAIRARGEGKEGAK